MRKPALSRRFIPWLLILPALACGPIAGLSVTPTPTKTATPLKPLEILPTTTPTEVVLPSPTPVVASSTEEPVATADNAPAQPTEESPTPEPPTPEPLPTDTPPPPTNTPAPPPPPTNTPAPPPPPTNTPAPPPPPTNPGPSVIIELPYGDTYRVGDRVKLIITVRDTDGVAEFSWGVFTENKTGVIGDDEECHNAPECRIEEEFETQLPGAFQIGVEARDAKGEGTIEIKQLYVG